MNNSKGDEDDIDTAKCDEKVVKEAANFYSWNDNYWQNVTKQSQNSQSSLKVVKKEIKYNNSCIYLTKKTPSSQNEQIPAISCDASDWAGSTQGKLGNKQWYTE